jgi:hypothetical protein
MKQSQIVAFILLLASYSVFKTMLVTYNASVESAKYAKPGQKIVAQRFGYNLNIGDLIVCEVSKGPTIAEVTKQASNTPTARLEIRRPDGTTLEVVKSQIRGKVIWITEKINYLILVIATFGVMLLFVLRPRMLRTNVVDTEVDSHAIYDFLQGEDLPWAAYMMIWGRLEEGTEARRLITDLFFDSEAPDEAGSSTLRDLSDQSWRKTFADYALKYPQIQKATIETVQELHDDQMSRIYWRTGDVRILTEGSFSLEKLLAFIKNLDGLYDQFQVASGSLSEKATDIGLDPIIDTYAEGGDVLMRVDSPDKEQEGVKEPINLGTLVRRLASLEPDCNDYHVECTESDPNDAESTIRVDMPVQGIGISDEQQLFVLLH